MGERLENDCLTTANMEEFDVDLVEPAQSGQSSNGSQSIPTVQTPAHEVQDFSRWHKVCEPFLLQTIRRVTQKDVNCLSSNNDAMRRHLLHGLEEIYVAYGCDLTFLNLTSNIQSHRPWPKHKISVRPGRSSIGSRSSLNSISSQQSLSLENDVQQSSMILVRDLRATKNPPRPRWRKRLLACLTRKGRADEKSQLLLYKAISDVEKILVDFEPELHTIGFRK